MKTHGSNPLPNCPNRKHSSSKYSVTRNGARLSSQGILLRYLCLHRDGASHSFEVTSDGAPSIDCRTNAQAVTCNNPKHKDAKVHSRGTIEKKDGHWSRFHCFGVQGDGHYFRILVSDDGSARVSLTKPPICLEHPKSKVARNGTKGVGVAKRQSYRCIPTPGAAPHYFSPPLSREAVGLTSSCATCEEILSPHRGTLTAARHTPWSLNGVVQALNNLSRGASYASVSLELRSQRKQTEEHLLVAHGVELIPKENSEASPLQISSWSRMQGSYAWHLAADLVEQYSPLLFKKVNAEVLARETKLRETNNNLLSDNPEVALATPIVYILDELPVVYRKRGGEKNKYKQNSWSLLVVVELVWRNPKDPSDNPQSEARLRLVRAYPKGDADAWVLVLAELPVRPDFIVADAGSGIRIAVDRRYGGDKVGFIPSLYHVRNNIKNRLMTIPSASTRINGRRVLVPPLEKVLRGIRRSELVLKTPQDLSDWWDELKAEVAKIGTLEVAEKKLEAKDGLRASNEKRLADAIPMLAKYPQVPGSNASVEASIRRELEPFLENRKHLYRNLARTNLLMDLAVCRSQGVFSNLTKVGNLIREDNEAALGWAPAPRKLADTQPNGASYSSLLDAQLIIDLSRKRDVPGAPAKLVRPRPDGSV